MSVGLKWSVEEEHLLMLLRPTHTYQEIENEFQRRVDRKLPGFRCPRSAEAVRKKCVRDSITPESCTDYLDDNPVTNQWERIREIEAAYADPSLHKTVGVMDAEDITTKILVLSDMHFPLARVDCIEQALNDHADADIVVANGDLLEGYVFSTFEKHSKIAALDEYNMGFDFIALLAKQFPKVVIVEGNHDARPSRALKIAGLPKEATDILKPNLLARIANGERLDSTGLVIEKLDFSNVYFQSQESWWVQIGKTLFIHPHTMGGSKPGWTVTNWAAKFGNRFDADAFDSVVCGHTHKIYKGILNGKLLIEQGCLVGPLGYAWQPRRLYHGNGMLGYAVIYQDKDGNTDFNRSNVTYLGEALPPKKPILS